MLHIAMYVGVCAGCGLLGHAFSKDSKEDQGGVGGVLLGIGIVFAIEHILNTIS
jgi:hypothetical protein